jgi:hypothetical protein
LKGEKNHIFRIPETQIHMDFLGVDNTLPNFFFPQKKLKDSNFSHVTKPKLDATRPFRFFFKINSHFQEAHPKNASKENKEK